VTLIWLATTLVASGQDRSPGQRALNSIKRLKCSFGTSTAGNWQSGEPQVRVTELKNALSFTIADINSADGIATMTRAEGASSVSVQLSGSNLYFLDVRASGATLTTVFSQESQPGRLKAVHTQTEPNLAQYYGDCEILEAPAR
jgi:hypothetical protein